MSLECLRCIHSRRRWESKYLDLQILRFDRKLFRVTGNAFLPREPLFENMGTPEKMCLIVRRLLWKLVENFGICKSNLFRLWTYRTSVRLLHSMEDRSICNMFHSFVWKAWYRCIQHINLFVTQICNIGTHVAWFVHYVWKPFGMYAASDTLQGYIAMWYDSFMRQHFNFGTKVIPYLCLKCLILAHK